MMGGVDLVKASVIHCESNKEPLKFLNKEVKLVGLYY